MAKYKKEIPLFPDEAQKNTQGPVECLGMTFSNDEERRKYFLDKLREGLEELHAKFGNVSFTTVDDAVVRMKSIEKWPMGEEEGLRELAGRMGNNESSKDLLQMWKDEVGFPHGGMEDILALSDPPYYTACPNPFIGDFIKYHGKPYDPKSDNYSREPFAADVSEGKNDPIYNAHSYHTKVPHKAIMRYILHYTKPGDVVFDGFCGTGMTGVAAQLCGDRATVESLGYSIIEDRFVLDKDGKQFAELGARIAILNDISPAATFIAYGYNAPVNVASFEREAKHVLQEVEKECGWMYQTLHRPNSEQIEKAMALFKNQDVKSSNHYIQLPWGRINYAVWSEFIRCSNCGYEDTYWDLAVDKNTRYKRGIQETITCSSCGSSLLFKNWEKVYTNFFDAINNLFIRQPKQRLVLINYSIGNRKYEKEPDIYDHKLLKEVEKGEIPFWFPTNPMMFKGEHWGDTWRAGVHAGITHVHHYYTKRTLNIVSFLRHQISKHPLPLRNALLFWMQSVSLGFTKLNRYLAASFSQVNRYLKGTLYVARFTTDVSAEYAMAGKIKRLKNTFFGIAHKQASVIATESTTNIFLPSSSVDYIFLDPPFGGNIMYSELNFIWESWFKLFTNAFQEAIESNAQKKDLHSYQGLMSLCFEECFRILKPGRWITVEFHNSKNSIWNSIQEAMQRASFVIADVRILDKKQMTMQQMTSGGSVKKDLVISAYKPNGGLEQRFKLEAGTEEGVWDFIRMHLKQLPIFVSKDGQAETIAERQNYLLFDRMVAFHVQRGVTVPLSAAEFYAGLVQRFSARDGMYFLPEQVADYDRKRMSAKEVLQLQLYVSDEASAIQWLKQQLTKKPQSFQELHPQFLKEISGWQKYEKPVELSDMLEYNFLRYDGYSEVPSQIHSYLSTNFKDLRNLPKDDPTLRTKAKDRWYVPDPNKAGDLEKLRERTLLREFDDYLNSAQKRLKVFRLEAVRAHRCIFKV